MNIVIVLSGGTGSRAGTDIPKQYIRSGGQMMITRTLAAVAACEDVDAIRIVCEESWQQAILDNIKDRECKAADSAGDDVYKDADRDHSSDNGDGVAKTARITDLLRGFSVPGETRQLSALNGMRDVLKDPDADEDDIVIIHDAARPFVKPGTISDIINACRDHDGAMPVLPMKDTVYMSRDGRSVSSLLDRDTIFAGQAPEAFRLGKYLEANEALLPDRIKSIKGASEPAIMAGMDVAMIPGDEGNYKVTTAEDVARYMESIV